MWLKVWKLLIIATHLISDFLLYWICCKLWKTWTCPWQKWKLQWCRTGSLILDFDWNPHTGLGQGVSLDLSKVREFTAKGQWSLYSPRFFFSPELLSQRIFREHFLYGAASHGGWKDKRELLMPKGESAGRHEHLLRWPSCRMCSPERAGCFSKRIVLVWGPWLHFCCRLVWGQSFSLHLQVSSLCPRWRVIAHL